MKYETTANRLKFAMNNAQITQQELADRSGVGKSSVSHYVNGTHEPGSIKAYAMADVLNVAPAWLMGFDVPMERDAAPASPEPVALRTDEMALLNDYNSMDIEDRAELKGYAKGLLMQDKYKKGNIEGIA